MKKIMLCIITLFTSCEYYYFTRPHYETAKTESSQFVDTLYVVNSLLRTGRTGGSRTGISFEITLEVKAKKEFMWHLNQSVLIDSLGRSYSPARFYPEDVSRFNGATNHRIFIRYHSGIYENRDFFALPLRLELAPLFFADKTTYNPNAIIFD